MLIQLAILLVLALVLGFGVNRFWAWLPVIWIFEIVFVAGLVMATAALDVYVRDLRYVVDSVIRVMFWVVPIFYGMESVPRKLRGLYEYNPVAALVIALRKIIMDAAAPAPDLLIKLGLTSFAMLAIGWGTFRALQNRFYEQL